MLDSRQKTLIPPNALCLSFCSSLCEFKARKMRQITLSRCRVGKVRKVSVRVKKMALSKKCIQLLMEKPAGIAWKGVRVKEGLLTDQAGATLEEQEQEHEQEQEMRINETFELQVKFTETDKMEFIVGSRHRRRN